MARECAPLYDSFRSNDGSYKSIWVGINLGPQQSIAEQTYFSGQYVKIFDNLLKGQPSFVRR